MTLQLHLADDPGVDARYFSWAPVPCTLRDAGAPPAEAPVELRVGQRSAAGGGRLRFGAPGAAQPEVSLRLPGSGEPAEIVIAGDFEHPSHNDGDVEIVVSDAQGTELASFPIMVRVRKDANVLDAGERDRFLQALAVLNDQGRGPFQSFRDSHTNATSAEAHFNAAFLPWHRAFLLDLERELQGVDPSVALPYWRFDAVGRRVFGADFMGAIDQATGTTRFAPTNPLISWTTDGVQGIARRPRFNTQTDGAPVLDEQTVVTHTGSFADLPGVQLDPFEIDPHGQAHVSFTGFIQSIDTAARDPLFYLLHCNVDRLWAKWQWLQRRFQPDDPNSFGGADPEGQRPPGHNLADSMWPWNGVITAPRPPVAPRKPLPDGDGIAAPGPQPTVRAMIDYQGIHDAAARLGFDYDDVPYQP